MKTPLRAGAPAARFFSGVSDPCRHVLALFLHENHNKMS
ncbi:MULTISPECIES: SWIM zinc finger family protein [Rhizobium]